MVDQGIQVYCIVEVVFQVQVELFEFGVFFDCGGFGVEVYVVEYVIYQFVLFVGLCFVYYDLGFVVVLCGVVQVGVDGIFVYVFVEFGVQYVQVKLGVVVEFEL